MLIAWNSPQNHPKIDEALRLRMESLAGNGLMVKRCMWSTSKCDTLNMPCDFIDTEIALFADAFTIVLWGMKVKVLK